MRWLPAVLFVALLATPSFDRPAAGSPPDDTLDSRSLELPAAQIPIVEPSDFDLLDLRAAERDAAARPVPETTPHSMFGIRRHFGFAAGYDNGVLHGSLGLYLTVVEWGRWNYGIPSPALGFGRYQKWDPIRRRVFMQDDTTLFISLASVHYRVGYLQSIGMNWYINLEQIFDMRQNMAGSQVGITLSPK